ncbi:EF-hand domain-containing protein [Caldimonas sp. KR1-144]|uniref:EF-hand domain-containing protein n=1 Tax=Caldimonas sp. KR1-144 TaxID=3400911 RepID=UPI003C0B6CF2
MTSAVGGPSSLPSMLGKAFDKIDVDSDRRMSRDEFKAFYEILKPGIATDEDGRHLVSEAASFERMDHDRDGSITREEMVSTGVLMPAELCDDSLAAMMSYLRTRGTESADAAACLLERIEDDALAEDPGSGARIASR